jgi:hypothetical protein
MQYDWAHQNSTTTTGTSDHLSLSRSQLFSVSISLLFLQKINCELLPDEPTVSLHQCCLLLAPPLGILFFCDGSLTISLKVGLFDCAQIF